jgi:hypothetical protein
MQFALQAKVLLCLLTVSLPPALPAAASGPTSRHKIAAQRLVEESASKHPEVAGIEIAVVSSGGCSTIASTDRNSIQEKCDRDEQEAMRTGEPFVEKEGDSFDVTLALHDATGKIIGTLGIDFKARPGQDRAMLVEQSNKILHEIESQISTKQKLLDSIN